MIVKAYGFRRHGKPTVLWLDDLGLAESNVVYGDAIYVTEAEIGSWGTGTCPSLAIRVATSTCATASRRSCRCARRGSMSPWG